MKTSSRTKACASSVCLLILEYQCVNQMHTADSPGKPIFDARDFVSNGDGVIFIIVESHEYVILQANRLIEIEGHVDLGQIVDADIRFIPRDNKRRLVIKCSQSPYSEIVMGFLPHDRLRAIELPWPKDLSAFEPCVLTRPNCRSGLQSPILVYNDPSPHALWELCSYSALPFGA
jgi:hypothetical protein